MNLIINNADIKKLLLYSLGFFLILVTNIGCSASQRTTTTTYTTNPIHRSLSLSRVKGQTHKYFSSRFIVSGNFITTLQIISIEGLPAGINLNATRNTIEGTPIKAGFYNITVKYNDKNKGTPEYGPGNSFWTYNTEISIYDKLN